MATSRSPLLSDDVPVIGRGHFFAVDMQAWREVCSLGLTCAVAYLVLARGTGRDNRTSSWSTNAVEHYTGIGRGRAKAAIGRLVSAGLIKVEGSITRPRYCLRPARRDPRLGSGSEASEASLIWLPNTLIDGAGSEAPPVELLRQSQSVELLEVFVELYRQQFLPDSGGVEWRPPRGIQLPYGRVPLGSQREFTIWAFSPYQYFVVGPASGIYDLARGARPITSETIAEMITRLVALGLVEIVPHLVEANSDDGEALFPLATRGGGEQIERANTAIARRASKQLMHPELYARIKSAGVELIVPVLRHFENVEVVGVLRLVYRPRTRLTAEWIKRLAQNQHIRYLKEKFNLKM